MGIMGAMGLMAQIPATNTTGLGEWLINGAAVLVIINQGMGLFRKVPQPLETKEAAEFVNRQSFHKHAELNREAHVELHEENKDLEKLHHELAREVSEMASVLELNGQRLVQMDSKIDTLLLRSH